MSYGVQLATRQRFYWPFVSILIEVAAMYKQCNVNKLMQIYNMVYTFYVKNF